MDGTVMALLESKPIRIEPQLDDQWPPAEPGLVQACNDAVWLGQFGFAEGHPFQFGPGCWQVTALHDHGPAAERGWPQDHRANLAARCDDPRGPGGVLQHHSGEMSPLSRPAVTMSFSRQHIHRDRGTLSW